MAVAGTRTPLVPASVLQTLQNADTNWATLTAAQKDQAMQMAIRVTVKCAQMADYQADTA